MEYSFEFSKARIYINKCAKTLAAIQKETGADVLINGGLYDMDYKDRPLLWLRVDGETLSTDDDGYWCYGWDAGDFRMIHSKDIASVQNAISCCSLVKDKKATLLFYDEQQGGIRGRSAIGTMPDGRIVLYCSKDGTSGAMTPEALQQYCLKQGWKDAIMLDSGSSSQCITPAGKITSTRKVHNVLCFWFDEYATQEEETDVNGQNVKVYSKAKNGGEKAFMSNGKRCTNFKVSEFACKDGSDPVFVSTKLVDVLQDIRSHFGKSTTVTSGYRTPTHNKKEGGEIYSQHVYGTAADIVVSGVTPAKVAAYAETLLPNKGGIGIYSNFVHVDVRETKSRWKG